MTSIAVLGKSSGNLLHETIPIDTHRINTAERTNDLQFLHIDLVVFSDSNNFGYSSANKFCCFRLVDFDIAKVLLFIYIYKIHTYAGYESTICPYAFGTRYI